jgi:hypothetical protein
MLPTLKVSDQGKLLEGNILPASLTFHHTTLNNKDSHKA